MGIHVHLYVDTDAISDERWKAVYEESLRVLACWPSPPLGVRWRRVAGERVLAFTPAYEHEGGWRIVGDAHTLQHAEAFELPSALPRRAPSPLRVATPGTGDDILVRVIRAIAGTSVSVENLFGGKTQGLPYHALVLAVATLAENRLPGAALAAGDIDASDALTARRGLESILGGSFAPPVVLDPDRLRARASAHVAAASLEDFLEAYRPEEPPMEAFLADLLGVLRSRPRGCLESGLRDAVVATERSALPREAREYLQGLVRATDDAARRLELDARLEAGALSSSELLGALVRGSRERRIRISEEAWRRIEGAGEEELRFLLLLTCIGGREDFVSLARTALFENAALRRALCSDRPAVARHGSRPAAP